MKDVPSINDKIEPMTGDKKNKTGHKKLGELIYRLSTRADFQADIKHIREMYKIPSPKTATVKNFNDWFKKNQKNIFKLSTEAAKILQKYKLPHQNFTYLLGYILTENKIETTEFLIESSLECALVETTGLRYGVEETYKEAGINYIKLLITEHASVRDVKNYLDRNWKRITTQRKGLGLKTRQIRSTQQKVRNKRICELVRASREELGLKKGEYRDSFIAKIISKEFGPISEDRINALAKKCRGYKTTLK